jgi:mannose-1-phosphate guanylyltransferase
MMHGHALLLCAGLGTRLRPLTEERPKPLVPVMGRPLASYAMTRLATAGVRHIVANTHHLGEQVLPALAPFAQKLNLALETVHEPELLGTGGAIRNVLSRVGDEPFYVYNGDILALPDLTAARALHDRLGASFTMVLREDPRAAKLGAIEVDADGRVVRMLDEGAAPDRPVRRCLFTGVYIVSPRIADDLPEKGCIVRHTLRRLLARGETVAGFVDTGLWHDLGTLDAYVDVHRGLLDGAISHPEIEPPFEARWLDPLVRVGEEVRLGRYLVAGARAELRGRGVVENAIVWDGAVVDAPVRDVIVTGKSVRVPFPSRAAAGDLRTSLEA